MPINANGIWEDPPLRVPLILRDIKHVRNTSTREGDYTTPAIECPYCGCPLLVHHDGTVVCSNVEIPVCQSLSRRWQLAIVEKER